MITKITAENSSRYDVLFDSIGKYLTSIAIGEIEAPDPESEEYEIYSKWNQIIDEIKASGAEDTYFEKDEISGDIKEVKIESLEAYFGIIKNLIDINPEYGIIPLDEPYFEINANTREIKPPPNFSVQVAGDESAETIFFKIDRYYDIWDLYHDDINIVIQWENAKGEKGISDPWIKLLDPNSEDDYIIFGWAITSTVQSSLSGIAAAPGRATFSIKFYKQGDDNSITYCLNTLPANIIINAGLSIDLNNDALIKEKNMKDIMLERFSNGLVKGVTPPPPPTIVSQNIKNGNTYIDADLGYEELIVIASTPSAGTLSHKWFKQNENNGTWEQCTKDPGGYDTGEKYIEQKISSDLSDLPDNFFSTYMIYADKNLEIRITEDEIKEQLNKTEEVTVYLKGYYLQVKSPGKYYCSVINHKGLLNTSQLSDTATFPEPLIPSVPQEIKSVGYTTNKNISLAPTDVTLPTEEASCPKTYAYQWFYKENEESETLEKLNGTEETLTLDTTNSEDDKRASEGYYLCRVFHSVNNETTPSDKAPYQAWRVIKAKPLVITSNYSLYSGDINDPETEIASGDEIKAEVNNEFYIYSSNKGTIEFTVKNYDDKYDIFQYSTASNLENAVWETLNSGNKIAIEFKPGTQKYIHIKRQVGEGDYISESPIFSISILPLNNSEE